MTRDKAIEAAIRDHQLALAMYGEDDPRSINALLVLMLTVPDDVFRELEELAHATKH